MLNCINADSTKYFSWGDTKGRNKNGNGSYSFSEANYKSGYCGSGHNLSSDIPQGNATYDAATANMGSPWKMPTKDQGQELIDNTTSTWTSINSVNGKKFTSKTDSSKYIFLSAGGLWHVNSNDFASERGYYWSTKSGGGWPSSICASSTILGIGSNPCYNGLSIRPIK